MQRVAKVLIRDLIFRHPHQLAATSVQAGHSHLQLPTGVVSSKNEGDRYDRHRHFHRRVPHRHNRRHRPLHHHMLQRLYGR